jgi:hypothetical protein
VTHRVNILRGIGPISENAQKTHCIHGHVLNTENVRIDQHIYIHGTRMPTRTCRPCERIRQKGRNKSRKTHV